MSEESQDVLPDDLDITKLSGSYTFPSPRKRRIASYSIFVIALAAILFGYNSDNIALISAGILSIVIGLIFFITAWPLNINDISALTAAASKAPFSVGHSSAQLSFIGWRSKPIWRVVIFSSDEPPSMRGIVEVDAIDGEILSTFFDEDGQTDA